MSTLQNRYRGVLLGLAAGDALGGSVEFQSRMWIADQFPRGVREILGGGPWNLRVGEVTDDTAMALCIARACTADGLDIEQVRDNFLAWYHSNPKDIGNSTLAALQLLDSGMAWDVAGEHLQQRTPGGVAGNGAVMRCAPVALRFRGEPNRLIANSRDVTRMTHADPKAVHSAIALNLIVQDLLNEVPLEQAIHGAIEQSENESVRSALLEISRLPYEQVESTGYVVHTLQAALWCAWHRPSAEEAIVTAVSMGDDTDTTGAVCGAIVGAMYGVDALPDRWLKVLEPAAELELLADQILQWNLADIDQAIVSYPNPNHPKVR